MLDEKVVFKHNWDTAFFNQFDKLFDDVLAGVGPQFEVKYGKRRKDLQERGRALYKDFHEPWFKESGSYENDLKSFLKRAKHFYNECFPHIEDCASFWQDVLNNRHLFLDSPNGYSALSNVKYESKNLPALKNAIEVLSASSSFEQEISCFPLLDILQKVFDSISIADIQYIDEYEMGAIFVKADYDSLRVNVLENIKSNIESHAFSIQSFQAPRYYFENIIRISCKVVNNSVVVCIENNGKPFSGDISKLGVNGYFHGERGHTGHGLYSALTSMKQMGGNLSVEIPKNSLFTFSYLLTLPIA